MTSTIDNAGNPLMFKDAQVRRTEVTLASYAGREAPVRSALADDDPTVRAAALSALDRLGTLNSVDVLQALNDADLRVRRRACELATLLPLTSNASNDIDSLLLNHLQTGDETMAELSAWSLGERHQQQSADIDEDKNPTETLANQTITRSVAPNLPEIVRALSETVHHHSDALVREAAVAALGCIATPEAKGAILHAIGDKATVRRRAVIALAAFEGDDVEAALALATGDRDWQVRQAAEDLLA
jgi:HEAT repeat protein